MDGLFLRFRKKSSDHRMGDNWQKVVGPRAEREAVRVVREEARWVDRDAPWELAVPRDETALRVRLRELAGRAPAIRLIGDYTLLLRWEKTEDGTLRWGATTRECIACSGRNDAA